MKKFALVLAAVAALAIGSFSASQPAKADGGAWFAASAVGWGYCHATYTKKVKRKTPFCAVHDYWHKKYVK